jgi:hypothetical protein
MTLSCKESLRNIAAFSPRDWAAHKEDAWIYGIVLGWGGDNPEDTLAVREELKQLHRWTDDDMDRLDRLHAEFNRLEVRP